MTPISEDILRAAAAAGGEARVLPAEAAAPVVSQLYEKYAGTRHPTRALWEYLEDAPSIHDPDAWRMAEAICEDAYAYMLIEDFGHRSVLRISPTSILSKILSETISFIFYIFDESYSYLVCFNDHDVLIGAGSAAPKVTALSAALDK